MTLKQLEAFYWAATSANFLAAARRLHVSQSSLSKRISELEVRFGKTLFDRSGHRAAMTETGERLLPLARRLLGLADDLRAEMADPTGIRAHCRFGVGEFAALTWLPDLVSRARTLYPDLMLEPCVDLGAALEERLDSGDLDFAVVANFSSRSSISSQAIAEVQFSWAAAPAMAGANRAITAQVLRDLSVITMPPGAGSTRVLDRWLTMNNLEVGRRLTCNNLGAIAGLVAAGAGVGFFPEGWLRQMVRRKAVVVMHSSPALPALQYTFQWRRDDTRPVVARLRELVSEVADFSKPNPLW